jgi:DNA-directed RNA polymerase specialized sigma24 family protein
MKKGNLSDFTDDQLLLLMAQNDKEAFTAIYDRHAPALYLDVINQMRNRATVEQAQDDTVHILIEVFTSLWNNRERRMTHKTLPEYLLTLADREVAYYTPGKEPVTDKLT